MISPVGQIALMVTVALVLLLIVVALASAGSDKPSKHAPHVRPLPYSREFYLAEAQEAKAAGHTNTANMLLRKAAMAKPEETLGSRANRTA